MAIAKSMKSKLSYRRDQPRKKIHSFQCELKLFVCRHEQQEEGGDKGGGSGGGGVTGVGVSPTGPEAGPHMTIEYPADTLDTLEDANNILIHHVKRQTAIHKEDKQKIKLLLRHFLMDLFKHKRQDLSEDEREDLNDNAEESSNNDSDAAPDNDKDKAKAQGRSFPTN